MDGGRGVAVVRARHAVVGVCLMGLAMAADIQAQAASWCSEDGVVCRTLDQVRGEVVAQEVLTRPIRQRAVLCLSTPLRGNRCRFVPLHQRGTAHIARWSVPAYSGLYRLRTANNGSIVLRVVGRPLQRAARQCAPVVVGGVGLPVVAVNLACPAARGLVASLMERRAPPPGWAAVRLVGCERMIVRAQDRGWVTEARRPRPATPAVRTMLPAGDCVQV